MGISIRDSGDSDTGAGSSAPADPARASSFFDYARFLQNVRRDYDRAEEMYQRTIEANPKDADILNDYAVFLKNVRRDYDRAEEMPSGRTTRTRAPVKMTWWFIFVSTLPK